MEGEWCNLCIRGGRPREGRSIRSAPISLDSREAWQDGGDLIPEETDAGDPAPRALAPEEPESRNPPRAVVTSPQRRWWSRRTSEAAAHPIHHGSVFNPVEPGSPASSTYASSPNPEMSRPASSSAGLTLTGVTRLMIRRITYDPANAKAATMTQARAWMPSCPGFPKNRPFGPLELIRDEANRPVARVPQMPPAPWHAKTSSESSSAVRARQLPT